MQTDEYWRKARLKRVGDADTVSLIIDLGFRTYSEQLIRLSGIVAPKIFRAGDDEEKQNGIKAREFVVRWFRKHQVTCGEFREKWPCVVNTERADGYGRYLGAVYCLKQHSLNDDLLSSGLVRPYIIHDTVP